MIRSRTLMLDLKLPGDALEHASKSLEMLFGQPHFAIANCHFVQDSAEHLFGLVMLSLNLALFRLAPREIPQGRPRNFFAPERKVPALVCKIDLP